MQSYLKSALKQFKYYQQLGEQTLSQLTDEQLLWQPDPEGNSIAMLMKHLRGNMLSRWTDFLESDGEKPWRDREREFEVSIAGREELLAWWQEGWSVLLGTLQQLEESDLERVVYIRNQGHTVIEAINRQLCHYSYHVGQMVYLGRMLKGKDWQSLSIARGHSAAYNANSFAREQKRSHFTDEPGE